MADAVLAVETLTAGYDEAAVIRDVDLTVAAGEVVALLGANGAGKTTTLRVVSGLVRPMAGRVLFGGDDLARTSPSARARLGIAHVPEGRGLFFGMTVAEHFRVGPRGEQIDDALAYEYFPKLAELKGRRVGLLSGGEQQMLALARAFLQRPRLLMLDEPSLGLAPLVTREVFRVVADLNEKEGLAVLVVEQNATIALTAAQRAYVLETGRVATSGSADELKSNDAVRSAYLGY